jgi:hypothetical protein
MENGWYHVMNRGIDARRLFPDNKAYEHFRDLLAMMPTWFGLRILTLPLGFKCSLVRRFLDRAIREMCRRIGVSAFDSSTDPLLFSCSPLTTKLTTALRLEGHPTEGPRRFLELSVGWVAVLGRLCRYVTSPSPGDTPTICLKDLHDLSTAQRMKNRHSNSDLNLPSFDSQWQATFCTHLKAKRDSLTDIAQ